MKMLDSIYEIGFDHGVKSVRRELIRLREPYLRLAAEGDYVSTSALATLDLLNELIDYTNDIDKEDEDVKSVEVLEVEEDEI